MPHATAHRTYAVRSGVAEGHRICALSSYDADLRVAFAPELGMVTCSMVHAGEEVLGQGSGLAAYVRAGATMGIPLLHPWATASVIAHTGRGADGGHRRRHGRRRA